MRRCAVADVALAADGWAKTTTERGGIKGAETTGPDELIALVTPRKETGAGSIRSCVQLVRKSPVAVNAA